MSNPSTERLDYITPAQAPRLRIWAGLSVTLGILAFPVGAGLSAAYEEFARHLFPRVAAEWIGFLTFAAGGLAAAGIGLWCLLYRGPAKSSTRGIAAVGLLLGVVDLLIVLRILYSHGGRL